MLQIQLKLLPSHPLSSIPKITTILILVYTVPCRFFYTHYIYVVLYAFSYYDETLRIKFTILIILKSTI